MISRSPLPRIREVLAHDDAVLFIGSGVSSWSGLPGWARLLDNLASYIERLGGDAGLVRRELANHDYLMAADFAVDALSPIEFGTFIREELHGIVAVPSRLHKLLADLGPSCFITTNYDRLLEDTLASYRSNESFAVVTNRHVVEAATIIQARSTHFVFKPHGDVGDIDSVVLSNHHYRSFRERSPHTVEALRVLLASRPVVFVGFSLRDPGFRLIADNLLITFQLAGLEHYAVMPDVNDLEAEFWRRKYGTRILSYPTTVRPEGGRSHDALYDVLKGAHPTTSQRTTTVPFGPAIELALIRYTNAVASLYEAVSEPLPLLASGRQPSARSNRFVRPKKLTTLLEKHPRPLVLVGSPGAGKSHGMRHAAKTMAASARDALLAGTDEPISIPVLIDLRQYEGDVLAMVEAALPTGLQLGDLMTSYGCRFFLDAVNEVPEPYETSIVDDLLNFVRAAHPHVVVISTRYIEHFENSSLDIFTLDSIAWAFVEDQVAAIPGLDIGAMDDVTYILTRPFFYQLFRQGAIDVAQARTPADLLAQHFASLSARARADLDAALDLTAGLRQVAFAALNSGRETIDAAVVLDRLMAVRPTTDAEAVLSWLVRNGVLLALPGSRVAFAHQLLTEYLAAAEVATRYRAAPHLLHTWLSSRAWDQTLMMAASMLDDETAPSFIDGILRADFRAAIRAVRYLDTGRREATSTILEWLADRDPLDDRFTFAVRDVANLPAERVHIPLLWKVFAKGNSLGGSASELLVRLGGPSAVREMLNAVFEHPNDYNLLQDVGRALADHVTTGDLVEVIGRLASYQRSDEEEAWVALVTATSEMLRPLAVDEVCGLFNESDLAGIQGPALAQYLQDRVGSLDAFKTAIRLVKHDLSFVFAIYFHTHFGDYDEGQLNDLFTTELVDALVSYVLSGGEVARWAAGALIDLAGIGVGRREQLRGHAECADGWARICLAFAADYDESQTATLIGYLLDETGGPLEHSHLIDAIPHEAWHAIGANIVVRLLMLGDVETTCSLAEALDSGGSLVVHPKLGPLRRWIRLLCQHDDYFYRNRFGHFISKSVSEEDTAELLAILDDTPEARNAIIVNILPGLPSLPLDELPEEILRVILDETLGTDAHHSDRTAIGEHASEKFVQDRLMPLIRSGDLTRTQHQVLVGVLQECGRRHARRYVNEDGMPL